MNKKFVRYNLKFEEKTSSNTNLVGEEASDGYSSTNEDEHVSTKGSEYHLGFEWLK